MKFTTSFLLAAASCITRIAAQGQNWAGTNLYYAAGLSEETRTTWLAALKDANIKVIRVWLSEQHGSPKNTPITSYPHLEPDSVGTYDDTVLELYDEFMVAAHEYGMKLMISVHAWNSLDAGDVYSAKYGKDGFYTNNEAVAAFDKRIQHVLEHEHKSLGKTWAELDDYIFAVETQNEAMIGLGTDFIQQHTDWQCGRASTIKAGLPSGSKILTTTGGESWVDQSVSDGLFGSDCADLDIIGIHGYENGEFEVDKLRPIVQKATDAGKMLVFQEWGACYYEGKCADAGGTVMDQSKRIGNVKNWANRISEVGMPWMYWQIIPNDDPHQGWDYEIGITENELWNAFKEVSVGTEKYSSAWDWSQYLSTSGSSSGNDSSSSGDAPAASGNATAEASSGMITMTRSGSGYFTGTAPYATGSSISLASGSGGDSNGQCYCPCACQK